MPASLDAACHPWLAGTACRVAGARCFSCGFNGDREDDANEDDDEEGA